MILSRGQAFLPLPSCVPHSMTLPLLSPLGLAPSTLQALTCERAISGHQVHLLWQLQSKTQEKKKKQRLEEN